MECNILEDISKHVKRKQAFPKGRLCWTLSVATYESIADGWPVMFEEHGEGHWACHQQQGH